MGQSPLIGTVLRSHYKILCRLGSGGFGDTYLAQDLDLPGQPQCVVKHLQPKDPDPAVLPIAKNLFDREAQTLYQLSKACSQIPRLFAHFEDQGEFYLVQEFVDGHDLTQEIIPGQPKSEAVVLKLLKDILEILVVVHQHQAIHRDIKPPNIMRRKDGKIMLIDFGAVKGVRAVGVDPQGQTSFTVGIGSPGYMPSEQAIGKPKLCSDVYAVGMTAIQALTGLMPDRLKEDPDGKWIWRNYTQVGDRLANIIDTMVHPYFSQRYPSAAEALQALLPLCPPTPQPQPPDSQPDPHQSSLPPIPPTIPTSPIVCTIPSPPIPPTVPGPPISSSDPSSSQSSDRSLIKSLLLKRRWLIGGAIVVLLLGGAWIYSEIQFETNPISLITSLTFLKYTLTGHTDSVYKVAINPNGQTLVSSAGDKTIKVWNLSNGTLLRTLSGLTGSVYSLALSPDGQTLVGGSDDNTITIWNLSSGTLLRTLSGHNRPVSSVVISPDGKTLFSGSHDNTIKVWNLSSGTLLRTLNAKSVSSVAISPDGKTLVSGGFGETIQVWDLSNYTLLRTLSGHTHWITSVAISPDGKTLVSGGFDKTIKVWNLSSGTLLRTLSGHTNWIASLAISPDGKILVSSGLDKTIKVWDLSNGNQLRTLSGHTNSVHPLAISPDGQTLFSGSVDKTIKVWRMPK